MAYITCKRCSITRVNQLCDLYEAAFCQGDKSALSKLKKLVKTAVDRGYPEGVILLEPDLEGSRARAVSWNVSSLLTDADMRALGFKTTGDA